MKENCWRCFYQYVTVLDLLLGRDVTLITAHKPLAFAMTKMSLTMSGRQIRQLNYISQFCQSFTHIAEIAMHLHTRTDTLSCLEINALQVSDFRINCEQFAIDQQTNAATLLLTNKPGGLQIREKQLEKFHQRDVR